MSLFAIGDIHGSYDKLVNLFNILPVEENDTIVFLGDYIDRGKDSRKVIEFLLDIKNKRKNTVFLMGNHERMFLDYLGGKNTELFLLNGGNETIKDYKKDDKVIVPEEHLTFFKSLEKIFVTDDYIFVHAGLKPAVAIDRQKEEDLLWIRGEFIFSEFDFKKKVIFGHTPMKSYQPYSDKYKIGIDTGAVYGGFLTAVKLPEEVFFQS